MIEPGSESTVEEVIAAWNAEREMWAGCLESLKEWSAQNVENFTDLLLKIKTIEFWCNLRQVSAEPAKLTTHSYQLIEHAHDCWVAYIEARNIGSQSSALVVLMDAMSDLATAHPEYNDRTGRIGDVE